MTNKTTLSPIGQRPTQWPHPPWRWVLAGAVALLAVWLWVSFSATPSAVKRVAITNNTDYTMGIAISGPGQDNWMDLGWATHNQVTVFEQVVDQGKTWTFRVSAQGHDGGEFSVTRNDLVRSGWRVTIPTSVETQLRTAGVTPDPRSQ
jgi:hypothetical protein